MALALKWILKRIHEANLDQFITLYLYFYLVLATIIHLKGKWPYLCIYLISARNRYNGVKNVAFPFSGVPDGTGAQLTHYGGASIHVEYERSGPLSQRSPWRRCPTRETITPLLTAPVNYLVCVLPLKIILPKEGMHQMPSVDAAVCMSLQNLKPRRLMW